MPSTGNDTPSLADRFLTNGGSGGGGGGGGGLALPVVADFKNGAYTANGQAVTLADLFTADVNYNAWDPASVQAGVGLVGGANGNPEATSAFGALVASGATYIVEFVLSGSLNTVALELDLIDTPALTHYTLCWLGHGGQVCKFGRDAADTQWAGSQANGAHKMALNLSPTEVAVSLDGSAISTISEAAPSPMPTTFGITTDAVITITKLTVEAPVPDATLPTLSV